MTKLKAFADDKLTTDKMIIFRYGNSTGFQFVKKWSALTLYNMVLGFNDPKTNIRKHCPTILQPISCDKSHSFYHPRKPSLLTRGPTMVKCLTHNPGVLGSRHTGSNGFFGGSVLGQDTSEPQPIASEAQERHE